jgi:pimeloyl-ACP methyl ester carboxylesterase
MKSFRHGHVEIAYLDEGEGDPILLVHGFGSNHHVNWVGPGWVETLKRAGRRVIAPDNRGHGASTKLYDPADYHTAKMADDAAALLIHLGIERTVAMGYSMGARICAALALARPPTVDALVLGGLGLHLVEDVGLPASIAQAMEAPSLVDIEDSTGRMFRAFADQTGADRRALAACIRGSRQTLSRDEVARITQPTLVAVGTRDRIAGSAEALAALMPRATALAIPGRDHNPAVGDKVFKQGVLAFLNENQV